MTAPVDNTSDAASVGATVASEMNTPPSATCGLACSFQTDLVCFRPANHGDNIHIAGTPGDATTWVQWYVDPDPLPQTAP